MSVVSGLTAAELEAIVAHELAHVGRHDFAVTIAQSIIETVLFFHPAVWWVSASIRREREHCCDDMTLELCADRGTYVRALVGLDGLRTAPQAVMAANGGSLLNRIRRIVSSNPYGRKPKLRFGRAPWLGGVATLVFVALAAVILCVPKTVSTAHAAVQAAELEPLDSSGWKATATIKHDDRIYFLGENVHVRYGITNVSDKPLRIDIGGDDRGIPRHSRFKVVAFDSTGKRVADPFPTAGKWGSKGGLGREPKIPVGQTEWLQVAVGRYCDFQEPGDYTLRIYHDLGWEGEIGPADSVKNELPTGLHVAPIGEAKITFAMPTMKQAGERVERMANSQRRHPNDTNYGESNVDFTTLRPDIYHGLLRQLTLDHHRTVARQAHVALRQFVSQGRTETICFTPEAARRMTAEFRPAWGEEVLGLRFGLAHTTDKRKYKQGERVPQTLFVQNVSETAVVVSLYADFFRSAPKVIDSKNVAIALETFGNQDGPYHEVTFRETVAPGEMFGIWHPGILLGPPTRSDAPDHQKWKAFPSWAEPQVGSYEIQQSLSFDVWNAKANEMTPRRRKRPQRRSRRGLPDLK